VDFISPAEIRLELAAGSRDQVLDEMVGLLHLEPRARDVLLNLLRNREALGSTGIGSGVAIPHSRSLVVERLRVAFGRKPEGVDFAAVDGKPVRFVFLIVAPPLEVSNQYLPVLGRIAQFCRNGENLARLDALREPRDLLDVLQAADV
jgi:PTS system nitrogen regulatory IIA component